MDSAFSDVGSRCRSARSRVLLLATLCSLTMPVAAEQLRVAVASNFGATLGKLAEHFEAQSGHSVVLSAASTGKHYAQIRNGAPFDAFFAADRKRPDALDGAGIAVPGSRYTYALGRLVLWSPRSGYVDAEGRVLQEGMYRFLAIANPKLAPYGQAAQQVMQRLGLWAGAQGKLVRGENIGQAFHYVYSGNAELGFIADAQLHAPGRETGGSAWQVPPRLYQPIEQQAVLLRDSAAGRAFMAYVQSAAAQTVIRDAGYGIP